MPLPLPPPLLCMPLPPSMTIITPQVCGADTPFPLVFEPLYLPGVERVVDAIRATVRF